MGGVGVGVVLLKGVHHCGGGLQGLTYAQVTPSETVHFLLPLDQDVRMLSYLSSTMSACMLPSRHDNNVLNL